MKKRVFIIHGWDGHPEEGWFPWLKKELEKNGFEVHVPQLPFPENPRIENWVPMISQVVGKPDNETYFVGHSLGCQTIARYLEALPEEVKVGGAIFVGGYFKRLTGIEDDIDVQETARAWLDNPINFVRVKSHLPKSVAIFSDDDPYVPLDNQDTFRDQLNSEIIIVKSQGHFSAKLNGTTKLPVALEALLKINKENGQNSH